MGREAGLEFWGAARILDALGRVLAEADGESEGLIDAALDYEMARRARFELPTARDTDIPLVRRELARLDG